MIERCCGPNREEVLDALARGETFGTWKRCPECAAEDEALLAGVFIDPRNIPPILPSQIENLFDHSDIL